MRGDTALVWLGVVAGGTVFLGITLIFLNIFGWDLAGSILQAYATIFAAFIAAAMIRHQIRENYRDQRRLEIIRYISDTEKQKRLTQLHDAIWNLRDEIPRKHHFRTGLFCPPPSFDFDKLKGKIGNVQTQLLVLAPVSSLFYSALKIKLSYLEEDIKRALECRNMDQEIEEYRQQFLEIREEVHSLIIAKTSSLIFNSEWARIDSKDWKAHYQ